MFMKVGKNEESKRGISEKNNQIASFSMEIESMKDCNG